MQIKSQSELQPVVNLCWFVLSCCTNRFLDLVAICVRISNWKLGKISAQPHTSLCIQFLDRENNDKNNTLPLRKQICLTIVWGCAEILPISDLGEFIEHLGCVPLGGSGLGFVIQDHTDHG